MNDPKTNGVISRSELIKQIRLMASRTSLGETRPDDISGIEVCGLILNAPALDVVPVVRCKDCKHWKPCPVAGYEGHNYCEWAGWLVGGNAYCAYGEVKDDD